MLYIPTPIAKPAAMRNKSSFNLDLTDLSISITSNPISLLIKLTTTSNFQQYLPQTLPVHPPSFPLRPGLGSAISLALNSSNLLLLLPFLLLVVIMS